MAFFQDLTAPDLSRAVRIPLRCALKSLISMTRWTMHHAAWLKSGAFEV